MNAYNTREGLTVDIRPNILMELQNIGRYELEKVLGEGAMGKVYCANDPVLKRKVAIKTIRMEVLDTIEDQLKFKARFFREAQIGGKIHHPNIVVIYDMGEQDDTPFIVLELVSGESMAEKMKRRKEITAASVIDMVGQICAALEAAHNEGIVHRDIKPQNIMLTDKGRIKILDFGVAKLVEDKMTKTGQFLGTVKYASPEQMLNETVDFRADLFALAIMTHELMTGQTPFPGQSLSQIIYRIVSGEPALLDPDPVFGLDPRAFHVFMAKALHLNKEQRYQSAGEFSGSLSAMFRIKTKAKSSKRFDFETDASGTHDAPSDRIETARNQFRSSLDLGQFDQAKEQLHHLEQLGATLSRERRMLDECINEERHHFDEALQAKVLEKAQLHYERLSQLGNATPEDHDQLTRLYHDRLDAHRKVDEQVRQARQKFRKAVQDGNVTVAESNLKLLQGLNAVLEEEVALFKEMMHMLRTRNASQNKLDQTTPIEILGGTELSAGKGLPTHFGPLPEKSRSGYYLVIYGKNGQNHRFPLQPGDNVVGRTQDAHIRVPSASVSRRHAIINVQGKKVTLRDEGSLNLTFHNKVQVVQEIEVHPNDQLWFGQVGGSLLYLPD